MKFSQLFADEDAVSPVIGVILMVAVTVVMAAIVGAFVLSLSSDVGVAPTAQFDVSTDTDAGGNVTSVEMRHRAGEQVQTDQLSVQIPTARSDVDGNETDGSIDVGDRVVVDLNESGGPPGEEGDEILLVWTAEGGGDSVILSEHTFPSPYQKDIDSAETA